MYLIYTMFPSCFDSHSGENYSNYVFQTAMNEMSTKFAEKLNIYLKKLVLQKSCLAIYSKSTALDYTLNHIRLQNNRPYNNEQHNML